MERVYVSETDEEEDEIEKNASLVSSSMIWRLPKTKSPVEELEGDKDDKFEFVLKEEKDEPEGPEDMKLQKDSIKFGAFSENDSDEQIIQTEIPGYDIPRVMNDKIFRKPNDKDDYALKNNGIFSNIAEDKVELHGLTENRECDEALREKLGHETCIEKSIDKQCNQHFDKLECDSSHILSDKDKEVNLKDQHHLTCQLEGDSLGEVKKNMNEVNTVKISCEPIASEEKAVKSAIINSRNEKVSLNKILFL